MMKLRKKFWAIATVFGLFPMAAQADTASTLTRYVGFRIVSVKTIEKWVSSDKKIEKEGFEGCEFGRYIVFDDGTYLRCSGYNYQYYYRPEVVILSNGSKILMIVGDEAYDMTTQ